jgi:hypothetical protein
MWPQTAEERLQQWCALRDSARSHALLDCVAAVNDWWWRTPQINSNLKWYDHARWPDPWQLLAEDRWCDLARALGMLYTVSMMDRADVEDLCLIRTQDHNLVQVNQGKYILNWAPRHIVNI